MYKHSSEYNEWQQDLGKSEKALSHNMEFLKGFFVCDEIYSAETSDNEVLRKVDVLSGVDLIVERKGHLFGVASRVQFGINYQTFTIRKQRQSGTKTELEKRIEAIKLGAIYPKWTLQMYCDEGNDVLGLAVCLTSDLYDYVNNGGFTTTRHSDNKFICIEWRDLADKYKLKTFNNFDQ